MSCGFHDINGNGPYMLPCIDFMNHDSREYQTVLSRDPDNKKFKVTSSRFIGKGEQGIVLYFIHEINKFIKFLSFLLEFSMNFLKFF